MRLDTQRPQLGFLGPSAIRGARGAEPLRLRPKTLALLAYLACADRPVSRRVAASLLFADADDPRGALRWHLSRIRRALQDARDAVVERADGIVISLDTDVAEFRRQAESCLRTFDPDVASATLGLYRGDFLDGLAVGGSAEFDNWLLSEESTLRTLFRRVAERYGSWAIEAGRAEAAVEVLVRLTSIEPYVEEGHVLLIRALHRAGLEDRARAAYERYAQTVRNELHADPREDVARLFAEPTDRMRALPREGFVAIRDVTLHVVEWPGGDPPLLCLHGAIVSGYVYAALAQRLAPEFRLIAPTARGNGFSDKPTRGYSAETYVDDMEQLARALGVVRPVIVGHSTGGAVATLLAHRVAARGLVLLDGVVGDSRTMESRFAAADVILDRARMRAFDIARYLDLMRSGRAQYSLEAERLQERMTRMQLIRMPDGAYRLSVNTEAVAATWASLVASDTLGALARLRAPVFVAWATQPWLSDDEPYFSEAIVQQQVQIARDAEIYVASRSNHASLIRDPEPALVDRLASFLRRIGEKDRAISPTRASAGTVSA